MCSSIVSKQRSVESVEFNVINSASSSSRSGISLRNRSSRIVERMTIMFQNANTGNDANSRAPLDIVRPRTRIAKRFHIILMMALEPETFVLRKIAANAICHLAMCFLGLIPKNSPVLLGVCNPALTSATMTCSSISSEDVDCSLRDAIIRAFLNEKKYIMVNSTRVMRMPRAMMIARIAMPSQNAFSKIIPLYESTHMVTSNNIKPESKPKPPASTTNRINPLQHSNAFVFGFDRIDGIHSSENIGQCKFGKTLKSTQQISRACHTCKSSTKSDKCYRECFNGLNHFDGSTVFGLKLLNSNG